MMEESNDQRLHTIVRDSNINALQEAVQIAVYIVGVFINELLGIVSSKLNNKAYRDRLPIDPYINSLYNKSDINLENEDCFFIYSTDIYVAALNVIKLKTIEYKSVDFDEFVTLEYENGDLSHLKTENEDLRDIFIRDVLTNLNIFASISDAMFEELARASVLKELVAISKHGAFVTSATAITTASLNLIQNITLELLPLCTQSGEIGFDENFVRSSVEKNTQVFYCRDSSKNLPLSSIEILIQNSL